MNHDELKVLLQQHNHPELAKQAGMVYQVWEDGEVTLQKAGTLLWARNLHMIDAGKPEKAVPLDLFPLDPEEGKSWKDHAYIFTDRRGAYTIRHAILGYYRYPGESEETIKYALTAGD